MQQSTQTKDEADIPTAFTTRNSAIVETGQLARASLTPPPLSLKDIALSSAINAKKAKLPNDFEPNSYTILCGRGKDHYNWVGNRRLRVIVHMNLERYQCARTKAEKTRIVMDVVELIHDSGGRFAKRHVSGDWFDIGYDASREKVGALFRDALQKKHSGRAGRSLSPPLSSSPTLAPRLSPTTPAPRESPTGMTNPNTTTHYEDPESDSESSHGFHPDTLFPF